MTIGSENLSNGSATAQDRFSGGVSAYRQNRREAAMAAENGDGELVGRRDGAPLPTRAPGGGGAGRPPRRRPAAPPVAGDVGTGTDLGARPGRQAAVARPARPDRAGVP